jgi:hypothetical protein
LIKDRLPSIGRSLTFAGLDLEAASIDQAKTIQVLISLFDPRCFSTRARSSPNPPRVGSTRKKYCQIAERSKHLSDDLGKLEKILYEWVSLHVSYLTAEERGNADFAERFVVKFWARSSCASGLSAFG